MAVPDTRAICADNRIFADEVIASAVVSLDTAGPTTGAAVLRQHGPR